RPTRSSSSGESQVLTSANASAGNPGRTARPAGGGRRRGQAWGSSRAQQRPETGLLEVVVAGQSFGKSAVSHDQERDAVGERPRFVGTAGEEVEAAVKEAGVGGITSMAELSRTFSKSPRKAGRFTGAASASATSVKTQDVVTRKPIGLTANCLA